MEFSYVFFFPNLGVGRAGWGAAEFSRVLSESVRRLSPLGHCGVWYSSTNQPLTGSRGGREGPPIESGRRPVVDRAFSFPILAPRFPGRGAYHHACPLAECGISIIQRRSLAHSYTRESHLRVFGHALRRYPDARSISDCSKPDDCRDADRRSCRIGDTGSKLLATCNLCRKSIAILERDLSNGNGAGGKRNPRKLTVRKRDPANGNGAGGKYNSGKLTVRERDPANGNGAGRKCYSSELAICERDGLCVTHPHTNRIGHIDRDTNRVRRSANRPSSPVCADQRDCLGGYGGFVRG